MHKSAALIFFGIFLIYSSCLAKNHKNVSVKLESGVFELKTTKYLEPISFNKVEKGLDDYRNPISSFMSFYSSMKNGDYDWWWNSWTPKSKESMTELFEEVKLGKEDFISKWGDDFKILEKIQVRGMVEKVPPKNYTIILFEKVYKSNDRSSRLVVLENIGNHWYCTQDLSSSPFFDVENITLLINTEMEYVELAE